MLRHKPGRPEAGNSATGPHLPSLPLRRSGRRLASLACMALAIIAVASPGCTTIQPLHTRYQYVPDTQTAIPPTSTAPAAPLPTVDRPVLTALGGPGALLISFSSPDLRGDFLIGSTPSRRREVLHMPDAFPVEVLLTNRTSRPLSFRPGDFRMEKDGISVAPLAPTELVRSYETHSTARAFPMELRVVPTRQGLLAEPAPFWAAQESPDTASADQRRLRREERSRALETRFARLIPAGESVGIVLLFPLLPPDGHRPYRLRYGDGRSPSALPLPTLTFTFHVSSTEEDFTAAQIHAFDRALAVRQRRLERDRWEIYDLHRQLHQHADETMRSKQKTQPPQEDPADRKDQ